METYGEEICNRQYNCCIAIYDVIWNILHFMDYLDVINIRLVNSKCNNLSIRKDLWLSLIKRDFIFLTDFEKKHAIIDPEKGYNIVRKYIFRYVVKIEKKFINGLHSFGNFRNNLTKKIEDSVEHADFALTRMFLSAKTLKDCGINGADIINLGNSIKDYNTPEKIINADKKSLNGTFASLEKTGPNPNFEKSLRNVKSQVSCNPSVIQQKIYNSLIEWREESIGCISEDIVEIICMDILNVLNIHKVTNIYTNMLIDLLNSFKSDLQYGLELNLMYNDVVVDRDKEMSEENKERVREIINDATTYIHTHQNDH